MSRLVAGLAASAFGLSALTGSAHAAAATTPLEDAVLKTSPTYYYPLAFDATDISSHSNPALAVADVNGHTGGTVAYTGTAATLDGTAYLGDGPSVSSSDFTVAAWVTPNASPNALTVLSAQGWQVNVTGGLVVWLDRGLGGGTIDPQGTLSPGRHQIVAADHANTVSLYVDGRLIGTHPAKPVAPGALSVGSLPGQAGFNALVGGVSDVAGWDRALSAAEVTAMYTAGSGQAPLRGCHAWRMQRLGHRLHVCAS